MRSMVGGVRHSWPPAKEEEARHRRRVVFLGELCDRGTPPTALSRGPPPRSGEGWCPILLGWPVDKM